MGSPWLHVEARYAQRNVYQRWYPATKGIGGKGRFSSGPLPAVSASVVPLEANNRPSNVLSGHQDVRSHNKRPIGPAPAPVGSNLRPRGNPEDRWRRSHNPMAVTLTRVLQVSRPGNQLGAGRSEIAEDARKPRWRPSPLLRSIHNLQVGHRSLE